AAVAAAPTSAMTGQLVGCEEACATAARAPFRTEVRRSETCASAPRGETSEGMSLFMLAHLAARSGRDTQARVKSSEIVGVRGIRGPAQPACDGAPRHVVEHVGVA